MKVIFVLVLMMAALSVNAQERFFKKLERVEYHSWIVPPDIGQALDSMEHEARVKNFYNNEEWLDFTIGEKDGKVYEEVYGEWETLIPDSLKSRLKNKEKFGGTYAFSTYALVNNTGKVLAVYFKVDPEAEDLLKQEELKAISDTIKNRGINPDNFDFRRYDFAQMNVALWKMKNPKMSDKKRAKIAQSCMDGRRPCVYGVVRLCGVGASWAKSLEN